MKSLTIRELPVKHRKEQELRTEESYIYSDIACSHPIRCLATLRRALQDILSELEARRIKVYYRGLRSCKSDQSRYRAVVALGLIKLTERGVLSEPW